MRINRRKPDFFDKVGGKPPPATLDFNEKERSILRQASAIAEKARTLLRKHAGVEPAGDVDEYEDIDLMLAHIEHEAEEAAEGFVV